jgi:transcriptional regulator with XRE-family HTH domain
MSFDETFGAMILKARKSQGISQEQLLRQESRLLQGAPNPRQLLSDLEQDRRDPNEIENVIALLATLLHLDERDLQRAADNYPEAVKLRKVTEANRDFAYTLYRARNERG